jgi:hypothetical protein
LSSPGGPQVLYMNVPLDSQVVRAFKTSTELPENDTGYPIYDDPFTAVRGETWPCKVVKVAAAGVLRPRKQQPELSTAQRVRPFELVPPLQLFGPNYVRVIDFIEQMSDLGRHDIQALLNYESTQSDAHELLEAARIEREHGLAGPYRLVQSLVANKWQQQLGHKRRLWLTQPLRIAVLAKVVEHELDRNHFNTLIRPIFARAVV